MLSFYNILLGLGGVVCVALLVQDFRKRAVHVVLLVALGVLGLVFRLMEAGGDAGWEVVSNVLFVTVVLGLMWLILKIGGKSGRIFNTMIGWGDVVFFYAAVGWLDPPGYALWFVSGLVLVLLGVFVGILLGRWGSDFRIPLAGLLAGWLVIYWPMYALLEEEIWALGMGLTW